MAHATWNHSSHRSQEQQLLLSSLKLFYKRASINYRRPYAASTAHRNIITSLQMGPLSRNFLSFSCPCWTSSHYLRLITKPLLKKVSSNQEASTSSCINTALKISHKIFIAETSFWAAIELAKLSVPPRALHLHTRVPCKLSEESRADYRTLLALLLIANCDAFLATSVFLPSKLSARLLQWRLQYFLLHIKPPWNSFDNCIAEISFWPRRALINAAHPQVHFNSTQECYTSSQKNPERTTASSSTSYHRWWCTSRNLRPFAISILINPLGITNLLCQLSNKLGMPIYLVNEIAFPPLTSNSTKCCTHQMSPSDQLSSPME